ncbi:hypothetical protein [Ralstonia wenshanensis]|uniref:hypothetical protein n=1 Tax=Ralstonia wenshanensis TaxID=2842456 RepID=UPI002AAD1E25|nr:hypothetical protein [Ralstonia wenshanensis]MDY7507220.1 hypothetical protein [Ralstonia wenshanensis]
MGILIQFPQPGTRTPPVEPSSSQCAPQDARFTAAYRRDLDRAVSLLLEHLESDAYDGVALTLKPKSPAHKPAFVVGGFYRHKLKEAANAAMQLHLALKLRAREQLPAAPAGSQPTFSQRPTDQSPEATAQDMETSLQEKWNETIARYQRCEQMLRIAFCQQLRASPETTAILLSITQLHIETIANCLWELIRHPSRSSPKVKLETLNAIQLFRSARAQVSAWMPPTGQESAYFTVNVVALSVEMLREGDELLRSVEHALKLLVGTATIESVGT